MSTGDRVTPRWEQIRSARAGCAEPLNTTTSFTSRPSLTRLACVRRLSDRSGSRVPGDPAGELRASGTADPSGPGKAHEAVPDARVVGVLHLDAGRSERLGIGRPLVAERVEVGRLDERRGQSTEILRVQR